MSPAHYEAILFDFDGVLADTEPAHHESWLQALAPLGLHVDWETYSSRYIGVPDEQMIAELCEQADPPVPFEKAWARFPVKRQLFEQRMGSGDAVLPAVFDLLKRLHGVVRMAVVTSSTRSEIEPILANSGLLSLLDTAVYGDEVPRLKPAPDPYLIAAARLGITRALVVEDSAAGIASGRAAGFDVLHIPEPSAMPRLVAEALQLNAQ